LAREKGQAPVIKPNFLPLFKGQRKREGGPNLLEEKRKGYFNFWCPQFTGPRVIYFTTGGKTFNRGFNTFGGGTYGGRLFPNLVITEHGLFETSGRIFFRARNGFWGRNTFTVYLPGVFGGKQFTGGFISGIFTFFPFSLKGLEQRKLCSAKVSLPFPI